MRIGVARVSTRDQHPEAQEDALQAAGCQKVFTDKASGKLARRPELDKALLVLREGDQLVVTKLDRLGRSLEHLIQLSKQLQAQGVALVVLDQGIDTSTAVGRMFFQILGAIAEFEHALMSERTMDGWRRPAPVDAPAARNPNWELVRCSWPGRCTTPATTPSSRSPRSSASPAPPSTGTWSEQSPVRRRTPSSAPPDGLTSASIAPPPWRPKPRRSGRDHQRELDLPE
jgi:hypothetical protein